MSEKRVYLDHLEDIHTALGKCQQFVAGMSFRQFTLDERTVFAVIRALEIVGEAAKQIPDNVRRRYADVPWREMAAMRDKLIHRYFGVDLAVVRRTATEDVPDLARALDAIVTLERNTDHNGALT